MSLIAEAFASRSLQHDTALKELRWGCRGQTFNLTDEAFLFQPAEGIHEVGFQDLQWIGWFTSGPHLLRSKVHIVPI